MADLPSDKQRPEEEENFATMLEQSSGGFLPLEPGQKIQASIIQIGTEWVFLDVGQKGEGILSTKELLDANGKMTKHPGETLSVYFLSSAGGELTFTTRMGGGNSDATQLEHAWQSGIPIEGRVEQEIKGGFEIRLSGNIRAFCPYSQMGLRRTETGPPSIIGQCLSFRITQLSPDGRSIIVSHRELLEEERERLRDQLKSKLSEGMTVTGTVSSLLEFGAFIDIGGIEGLLPISEISYGRVEDICEFLQVGQTVNVVVKKIDWESQKVSFSLRETQPDPWDQVAMKYKIGSTYSGAVSRLAPFGAFVTLEEGVDGLLHISQLNQGKRLKHAKEIFEVGQTIFVIIDNIDSKKRRISLKAANEWANKPEETSYDDHPKDGFGTFADLIRKASKKRP